MSLIILVNETPDTTCWAGYQYGRAIYDHQIKSEIKEDNIDDLEICFPMDIELVSVSFVEGLFSELIYQFGETAVNHIQIYGNKQVYEKVREVLDSNECIY